MTPATRQIAFINSAHLITHYCLLILPTAVLTMAVPGGAFGPDYGPILQLATGGFVLYGLLSLPQGWLAQKFGRKALMTAFFLGAGASLVAAGLSDTSLALMLALGSVGVFASIYHPIGTAMLVEAAGEKVGKTVGMNGVFGNIGVATAPVMTAFLAVQGGWRLAFIVPGIVCLGLGVAWSRMKLHTAEIRRGGKPFPTIPPAVVRRAVIVLLTIAAVSGLVFNAFTLLRPKLMAERLAGDASLVPLAGLAAFLATICGALTQLTVGRLIDRTTLKRAFLPLALLLAPALFALSYVQGWVVVPIAGLVAAALFGQVTVNETMTARYISPALRARMYSVRFFVGFLGSAAAAPLIAVLYEHTGNLTTMLLVLAGFALITMACALFFPDRPEELAPELWEQASTRPALAPVAAE